LAALPVFGDSEKNRGRSPAGVTPHFAAAGVR
jgi:hypothetical protein